MICSSKIKTAVRFTCPIQCITSEEVTQTIGSLRELGFHWASGAQIIETDDLEKWLVESLDNGSKPVYLTPTRNHTLCWATFPDHPNRSFLSGAFDGVSVAPCLFA